MAMTTCPECEHPVSTLAASCPHCGCVFDTGEVAVEQENPGLVLGQMLLTLLIFAGLFVAYCIAFDMRYTSVSADKINAAQFFQYILSDGQSTLRADEIYFTLKAFLIHTGDDYVGVVFGQSPMFDVPLLQNIYAALAVVFLVSGIAQGVSKAFAPSMFASKELQKFSWGVLFFGGLFLVMFLTR